MFVFTLHSVEVSVIAAVETLVKVLREAEAAELVVEQDPIGAVLQQRTTAGKQWQEQATAVMANLKASRHALN